MFGVPKLLSPTKKLHFQDLSRQVRFITFKNPETCFLQTHFHLIKYNSSTGFQEVTVQMTTSLP